MNNVIITASGSADVMGDEFPSPYAGNVRRVPMTAEERAKSDAFTADWVRRNWGVDLAEIERNRA